MEPLATSRPAEQARIRRGVTRDYISSGARGRVNWLGELVDSLMSCGWDHDRIRRCHRLRSWYWQQTEALVTRSCSWVQPKMASPVGGGVQLSAQALYVRLSVMRRIFTRWFLFVCRGNQEWKGKRYWPCIAVGFSQLGVWVSDAKGDEGEI